MTTRRTDAQGRAIERLKKNHGPVFVEGQRRDGSIEVRYYARRPGDTEDSAHDRIIRPTGLVEESV